jgi:hypothetical protein
VHCSARAIAAGLAFATAGCAIHPLPENFAGVPTYTIVRQIRCETRQAIADSAIRWLTTESEDRVDPESRAIGLQFANGRPIQQFSPKLFKGRVASIINLFFDTGVAYNFDLEMSEVNNLDTEINLLKPFTNSKFTLGIKAGLDRSRKNERTFTVTDTFSGLIRLPDTYCNGRSLGLAYDFVVPENYLYPVVGRIGADHLVHDFINLTLFANLAGEKDHPKGPPTLVDALEFQTILSGSLAPKVTFTPTGTGLSVTDASLTGVATRTDLHRVTMGLAIAGPGVNLVAPVRTTLFTTNLLTARRGTDAEANAAEAVNQFLTLKLFRPSVTIVQ